MNLGSQSIRKPIPGRRGKGRLRPELVAVVCLMLPTEATESQRILGIRHNAAKGNETLDKDIAAAFDEEGPEPSPAKVDSALGDIKDHWKDMEEQITKGSDRNIENFKNVENKSLELNEAVHTLGKSVQNFGSSMRNAVETYRSETDKQTELNSEPIEMSLKFLEDNSIADLSRLAESQKGRTLEDGTAEDGSGTADKEGTAEDGAETGDEDEKEKGLLSDLVESSLLGGAEAAYEDNIGAKVRLRLREERDKETEKALDDSLPLTNGGALIQLQASFSRKSGKPTEKLKSDAGELLLAAKSHLSELHHSIQVSPRAQGPALSEPSKKVAFLQASAPAQQT